METDMFDKIHGQLVAIRAVYGLNRRGRRVLDYLNTRRRRA